MRSLIMACALLLSLSILPAQGVIRTHQGSTDNDASGSAIAGGEFGTLDGVSDVAVGSPAHNAGGGADQGMVEVFSGMSGASLQILVGAAVGDRFGAAVGLGGDVDGDGSFDIIVGAPLANPGLGAGQGQAIVYSGATGLAIYTIDGTAAGDGCGSSVAIIGDINSDAQADFAVSSPDFTGTAGAGSGVVVIYSGMTGLALFTIEGTTAGERYGASIAALGDTNGDGTADLGVGSPAFTGTAGAGSGRAAIISGATGAEIFSVEGDQAGSALGTSVAAAGDYDADSWADLAAGAPLFDGTAGVDCGRGLVYSGATGATLLDFEGADAGGECGTSIGGGGDTNRDGFDDLIIGSPLFDGAAGADSGRAVVISGADGSELWTTEGSAAGDLEGQAVAGIGDLTGEGRTALATGAPARAAGGTARGEVTLASGDADAGSVVSAYPTAALPTRTVACDADGDGDQDLIVLSATEISVLWNGDQLGTTPDADLSITPRTDVSLSVGATAVSVTAGQLDADAACEIVVGRSDGSMDIIDGTGSGATTAFALTGASPFTVDGSVSPGPISGVALLGSGASATVICCGAGSLTIDSFVDEVSMPLTGPVLSGALVTGGSFTAVAVADIDGDANDDIIATNASAGGSGGVHVLDGANAFAAAVGSPFSAGALPLALVVTDLDGDTVTDDVAIAAVGLAAGGVRVLPDYVSGSGFSAAINPGLAQATAITAGNFDGEGGLDLAAINAAGEVVRLLEFDGSSFLSQVTAPLTSGNATDIIGVQLTSGVSGDSDEIAAVHLSADRVSVWRLRRVFALVNVPSTGCPFGGPIALIGLSGNPNIGSTNLMITLTGSSPFALAFLAAEPNTPLGGLPTVDTTSGCGVALFSTDLVQFYTFTNALGSAATAAGLPTDPAIIGAEYLLQWGILDGGPVLSTLSVSDAITVTVGEL